MYKGELYRVPKTNIFAVNEKVTLGESKEKLTARHDCLLHQHFAVKAITDIQSLPNTLVCHAICTHTVTSHWV